MQEKILNNKKNGMLVLILTSLLLLASIGLFVFAGIRLDAGKTDVFSIGAMVVAVAWWLIGWIP